jgi:hypothetical protein
MPCEPFRIEGSDGRPISGFVCFSRRRRSFCQICKRGEVVALCDWAKTTPKVGDPKTCDARMCTSCRRSWLDTLPVQPSPERRKGVDRLDLCPDHFAVAREGIGPGLVAFVEQLEQDGGPASAALARRLHGAQGASARGEILDASAARAARWLADHPDHEESARVRCLGDIAALLALSIRSAPDASAVHAHEQAALDLLRDPQFPARKAPPPPHADPQDLVAPCAVCTTPSGAPCCSPRDGTLVPTHASRKKASADLAFAAAQLPLLPRETAS